MRDNLATFYCRSLALREPDDILPAAPAEGQAPAEWVSQVRAGFQRQLHARADLPLALRHVADDNNGNNNGDHEMPQAHDPEAALHPEEAMQMTMGEEAGAQPIVAG